MATNYFTMWGMLALMTFGALCDPILRDSVMAPIHAAFPSDPSQRYALERCREFDPGFSRFSDGDRDRCYRAVLHTSSN